MVDVEGPSPVELKEKGPTPVATSTSIPILSFSHYAHSPVTYLDFIRVKDDIPRAMYMRLARFAKEFGGVFAVSQLVKD